MLQLQVQLYSKMKTFTTVMPPWIFNLELPTKEPIQELCFNSPWANTQRRFNTTQVARDQRSILTGEQNKTTNCHLKCQTSFGPQEDSDWRHCVADVIRRGCSGNQSNRHPQTQQTFLFLWQPLIRTATRWHNMTSFFRLSHRWDKRFSIVYFPFIKSKNFSSSHFLLRLIENEKQNLPCTNFKKMTAKEKREKLYRLSNFPPPLGLICAVNYSSFLNSHYLFTHMKLAE